MKKVRYFNLSDNYFNDILDGIKTFEIRKNNYDFKVGDIIRFSNLNRIVSDIDKKITYINYTKDIYPGTDLVVLGLGDIK